jgi:predicted nucleic acid-binding protein
MVLQQGLFRYVFDASSLINIERNRKIGKLRKAKGAVLIPEKVAQEVNMPNSPLHRFITKYPHVITLFQKNEEDEYLKIRSQIGIDDGEAAAITIALMRKLPIVIDDLKGKRKSENHGVKTVSWQDYILSGS